MTSSLHISRRGYSCRGGFVRWSARANLLRAALRCGRHAHAKPWAWHQISGAYFALAAGVEPSGYVGHEAGCGWSIGDSTASPATFRLPGQRAHAKAKPDVQQAGDSAISASHDERAFAGDAYGALDTLPSRRSAHEAQRRQHRGQGWAGGRLPGTSPSRSNHARPQRISGRGGDPSGLWLSDSPAFSSKPPKRRTTSKTSGWDTQKNAGERHGPPGRRRQWRDRCDGRIPPPGVRAGNKPTNQEAFDLNKESDKTRDRYDKKRSAGGLARRLVERGPGSLPSV